LYIISLHELNNNSNRVLIY
jgi:tetrahydromethanopterin S-methyltransferase subunit G